ncbi:DNA ligase [Ignatzschineria sp. F8392]|nr:DNA ligase [Ignatzschineria sp. F8392]
MQQIETRLELIGLELNLGLNHSLLNQRLLFRRYWQRFFWHFSSPILLLFLLLLIIVPANAVPLQHGKSLTPAILDEIIVQEYFVSEKLDGVRGYWDGEQLLSRQGYEIVAPKWFTEHLGDIPLDGELWLGRETFQEISALIARADREDPLWSRVTYQIFDLPAERGPFRDRVAKMAQYLPLLAEKNPHIAMIPQIRVNSKRALKRELDRVVSLGGEGLMLHHQDAFYQPYIRHGQLLKMKKVEEDCAMVIGYTPGKGKYRGMVGALRVKNVIEGETKYFKIGSGLKDHDRQSPPEIGQWIRYRHNGFTDRKIPRFARVIDISGEHCEQLSEQEFRALEEAI